MHCTVAHGIKMVAPLCARKETNSSYLKTRWNFKNRLIIFSQLAMVDLLLVRMSSKTQQFWL